MRTVLDYLVAYCDEVSPKEFYRYVFPEGELDVRGEFTKGKYTAVAVSISKDKRIRRYTVTDDLDMVDELGKTDDFCIMSPISYAGKSRKSDKARFLYALAIDVDGIRQTEWKGYPKGIVDLFYQFDGNGPSNYLPKPTMMVFSGSGLHLYYVFEKPIPLFPNVVKELEKYKRRLTWQLWTQGVTDLQGNVQYESLFQGFRMPGTITKDGRRTRAFLVDRGTKVTMEYMNEFVPLEDRAVDFAYKSDFTLCQARERYPEWYDKRIVKGQKKGTWTASRAVYDWWKQQIYQKTEDGHRYWSVMALAAYAMKCGISREEVEHDALGMVDMLHSRGERADNPFTVDDVLAALEAYNDSYITYPIDTISYRTGISIKKNKRNGRKQLQHLQLARGIRQLKGDMGEVVSGGGRPTAEQTVREWREKNPNRRKADCIHETGLSKPTVYKWWSDTCG